MKTVKIVSALLVFLVITMSCASKMNVSWTQPNFTGDTFSKIVVVGIGDDLEARNEFEKTAVKKLVDKGFNAVEGIGIFPHTVLSKSLSDNDWIKIIEENKVDAIITMSLVNSRDVKRYVQGENYVVPSGYYRVGRYIHRRYTTVRTPGYYVPSKSYLIEAVLYNLKGELYKGKEVVVWNGQSSLIDPSSIESSARNFTSQMVNQLISDGILK